MKAVALTTSVLALAMSAIANPVLTGRTNGGCSTKRTNSGGCEPEPPAGACPVDQTLLCCVGLGGGMTFCYDYAIPTCTLSAISAFCCDTDLDLDGQTPARLGVECDALAEVPFPPPEII